MTTELAIKPQIKVEKLEFEVKDPEFEGGSTHTARATLINPTAKEFTYTSELYLGVTKAATTGVSAPFTIPAGGSLIVDYTIPVMPVVEAEYTPYIDAWVGTELIKHFEATEKVTIAISPGIEIGPITWL